MIIITTQCFYPNIGGIEALMTSMAAAIHKVGKDVLVVADGTKDEKDRNKKYNIKRFNGWKPIRRIKKAKYISQLCNTRNIEAIYADSWKSVEYLKNINVPIFVLAHGTEIQKNISNLNFYKKFKQKRILSSYSKSKKIIANSNYTKELIKESLKIDSDKINIVHPGIDIYEKFIRNHTILKIKKIINNSHPVLLTLARLELRKGHKLILEALSRLIERYPNLLYIIAGDGPYKKEIEKYAKELRIIDNIRFLGWITEPEKSVLLKSSNLFIMTPHLDKQSVEGFGMSFIDAAFHSLATIGTNSGGISDSIIDGKTGLIARESDVNDITAKIDELLSNSKKRIALGKAGQKNALEKFQWKYKVKEYLSLI